MKTVLSPRKDKEFYIPRTLQLEAMFPDKREFAGAAYLVSRILWGMATWQARDGWVPLKATYLQRFIPRGIYALIRDRLINKGVIECDFHYLKDEKSYGFRLGAEHRRQPLRRVRCEDERMAARLRKREYSEYNRVKLPVHKYLRSQFDQLEIDRILADQIIETTDWKAELLSGYTIEDYRHACRLAVQVLASRQIPFSFDRFGRVHTPLTHLPTELRQCLRVDGELLLNIDITNSQPLILGLVVKQFRSNMADFQQDRVFKDRDNPYRWNEDRYQSASAAPQNKWWNPRKCGSKGERENGITIANLTESIAAPKDWSDNLAKLHGSECRDRGRAVPMLHADEQEYLQLCADGRFYETLADIFGVQIRNNAAARKELKQSVFRELLFGQNRETDWKRQFREHFPNVMQVIQFLKQRNYRQLAWVMQNFESWLLIWRVCGRLRREVPNAPIFTIHDSIMTTSRYVPVVQDVMRGEFERLGVTPTLNCES